MTAPSTRWIGLAGPTASGKSAAAMALARVLPVEIVSVDSALVYRGMDIGTAKPSAAERAAVPQHLIDIRDPLEPYNAAAFVADTSALIDQISARGRLPLLVGGTLLYFKALIDGLDPMPAADVAIRAQIEAEAVERGWPALHAELAGIDPRTAARLAPNDRQRVGRALEVWRVSGQPLSSFHATNSIAKNAGRTSGEALFSFEPIDRGWLHERIARRFDAMLREGFIDEVQRLRARGDLTPDLPSMRCVGYRQAWQMLDAMQAENRTQPSASDLASLGEHGTAATRQLAKRQLTWLRGMPTRHVIAADAPDAVDLFIAAVHAHFGADLSTKPIPESIA